MCFVHYTKYCVRKFLRKRIVKKILETCVSDGSQKVTLTCPHDLIFNIWLTVSIILKYSKKVTKLIQFNKENHLPLLINGRILPMIIWMHLYVTGAYVYFITIVLQAMVMRLLPIMCTVQKLRCTIVTRRKSQKSVRQTLIPFFVPLWMATDLFLFAEHFATARYIVAMVMFTNIFGNALIVVTVQEWLIFFEIFVCISCK